MANNPISKEVLTLDNNKSLQRTKLDNKYKLITTWIICFCSLVYGLTSYIIGPALNDMKIKLNASTDSITIVFGSMLIGYTLGAVINGIIFNYVNRQLVLTVLLVGMGGALTLVPYCPNLFLLFADAGLCGFGGGGIDTAQVVWIIEMWAEKSSTYLSGYQFFFALGTFISPLMTRPFLAEEIVNHNNHSNTSSLLKGKDYVTEKSHNLTDSQKEFTESQIEIPFGIVGALLVTSGALLLVLHFYRRYVPPVEQNDHFVCKCPKKWKIIYITLGLLTLAPYVGMEIMNFNLIATFAKNSHLDLTASDSALVQSLLAGAFALFRAIFFFISLKFWSENLLYFNFSAIFLGNTLLFLYEFNHYSKSFLWAGAVICGTGFSSIFPTIYAFLENQFTISNTIGGLFVCMSGLMAAILPTLCGQFIDDQPLALIYINYSITSLIAITLTVFKFIIYNKSKSKQISK